MKFISFVFIALLPVLSVAGDASGKITGYIPYSTGGEDIFFIRVQNTNGAACNTTSRYTMNSSNQKFEGTRAAVMAAYLAGVSVRVKGLGTCNNFSNSEDMRYICLGDTPC